MKRGIRILTLGIGILLLPLQAARAEGPSNDPVIQLFLQACAATYAHAHQVASVATNFGFTEISGADAEQYLAGQSGMAWRGLIESKPYAVTVLTNGLCTVFVHEGDPEQIRSAVESWLPPASLGIVVTREDLSGSPNTTTISYELRGGKVKERWVVTTSSNPSSSLRAVLSWNRL
jgi:hypothetical protein